MTRAAGAMDGCIRWGRRWERVVMGFVELGALDVIIVVGGTECREEVRGDEVL